MLKTIPLRTTSLIVTFFTKDHGKIKGVVKGVRQEREMRNSLYEFFTRVEIVYYEKLKSDLHLISEASFIDTYESIRMRLEPLTYASYFSELVDETTEVHDPQPKIFELLDFAYRYLPAIPGEKLSRLFEIKLLREVGWLPYLEACLACETSQAERYFFSARQGALVCPSCLHKFADARPISADVLNVMRYYVKHDMEESLRQDVSRVTEEELKILMERFFLERIPKPFKSRLFLEKIKPVLK